MNNFIRLTKLVLPAWQMVVGAALLGWLTIGGNVGLLAASAHLITGAALHPPVVELMTAIVGVRFFGVSRAVFRYAERYVTHDVTFRALSKLRTSFYRALEPLAPAKISGFRSGDLLSRFAADVENLQYLYLRVLAPVLVALLTGLSVSVFLGWFHWQLTFWFSCLFIAAGLVLPCSLAYFLQGVGRRQIGLKSAQKAHLADSLRGIADLIMYNSVTKQSEQIGQLGQELAREQDRSAKVLAAANAASGLLAHLALWAILICGIGLVNAGRLDGRYLAMLVLAAYASFEALAPLTMAYHYLAESLSAGQRLFDIIDTSPAVREAEGLSIENGDYSIRVENLKFCYGQAELPVLNGLSFVLPQGKRVAVVGASGSGKSTLLNILLRFWDYHSGAIYLGNREISAYAAHELRTVMGVVTQYTHLFNATIRENLCLAKPGASEAELIEAACKAQLWAFIQSLPAGLNTYIGEGGLKLSGGQRRRLVIARAILKDAPILLLDEVTSGLDAVTEREVMAALDTLMVGKTTLMITHRLIGLETADEILVLGGGQILERGTYTELLRRQRIFYRMWELQQIF